MDKITQLLHGLINEAGEIFVTAGDKVLRFTVDMVSDKQQTITKTEEVETSPSKVTIVTGLWNLGRGSITEDFKRPYDNYKEKFAELLKTSANMFIYVAKEDEEFVWQHRQRHNTEVKIMELEEFKQWFEFYDKVQEIRTTPTWSSQAGWLQNSPQATLEYYNPVVMSKMFLLNNASIFNPFNSEYFYWIDAGIGNTVHPGYFYKDNVFEKLPLFTDTVGAFTFLTYPYEDGQEIHGFERAAIAKYSNVKKVKYVCRGGFFGGNKEQINKLNGLYHSVLSTTLDAGHMGTEESIFTILAHKHASSIYKFAIQPDGLIWPFFEKLKYFEKIVDEFKKTIKVSTKTNLYVLGFNSPNQFKTLCESLLVSDPEMFENTNKILVNNSTDTFLFTEYDALCEQYNFTEIHKENLGICGGRQFIAEHFEESDAELYMFFEDDMLINSEKDAGKCKCGFDKYVPQLYTTLVKIMDKEDLDFLKFSFAEFYGDNSIQWAWYNVPQNIRTQYWPEYDKLPEIGLDENAPKTVITEISVENEVPYALGEIYYSNWPQIVSRKGNKKMFLDTTWQHPYEQTWMSHMFQLTKNKELRPGVLLASPVTHNRFDYYEGGLRKES